MREAESPGSLSGVSGGPEMGSRCIAGGFESLPFSLCASGIEDDDRGATYTVQMLVSIGELVTD